MRGSDPSAVRAAIGSPLRDHASSAAAGFSTKPLLVAIDLHLVPESSVPDGAQTCFDGSAIALSEAENGGAIVATDFQADGNGFVRVLVVDRGLGPSRRSPAGHR